MRGNSIRKIFIALIIIVSVMINTDCKKQPKCGCGKDILFTLTGASANIIFTVSGEPIYCMTVGDPYSTYTFCNPTEMFSKLADAKSGDILLVSGPVYWNCAYVYQSSNSSYQSMYKSYDIQVTDLKLDLYGKK
jgi:hypothetical protein